MSGPGERTTAKAGVKPRSATLEVDAIPLDQGDGEGKGSTHKLLLLLLLLLSLLLSLLVLLLLLLSSSSLLLSLLLFCCCCLLAGCLTSQQHATVSQGRICSDNSTCCHTEKKIADQTFYLTSLYVGWLLNVPATG